MPMSDAGRISAVKHGPLLAMLVTVFVISAFVSLAQLNQSLRLLEAREDSSMWSIAQLRGQIQRFNDALLYYRDNSAHLALVQQRYDLLWSCFPTILNGVDGESFSEGERNSQVISQAFDALKQQENLIFQKLAQSPEVALQVREVMLVHQDNIQRATLGNFHMNSREFSDEYGQIIFLHKQIGFLILGLIITGSVFLQLVLRSNRRNRRQALHDGLTGLPNRDYLHGYIARLCQNDVPFVMHMIDLNGFKHINDSLGHHIGDELLKLVGKRIARLIGSDGVVCRLGGDEFAVVQKQVHNAAQGLEKGHAIIAELEAEYRVQEHSCRVGASIGTVLSPTHGNEVATLLSRADIAMYKAKELGPASASVIFETPFEDKQVYCHKLNSDLREALASGGLHMQYQPIVSLGGGNVRSMEALLRWNHPTLGFVSPFEVVAVAEQYGLADELGCWIIEEVCRQKREWLDQGYQLPPVSINISPSMYRLDLVDTIFGLLDKYQLEDGSIWIEVTEDTTMGVIQQAQPMLNKLSTRGVSIALDDFGTGLSSLSHLRDLNFQALKIDRSFVKDICKSETSAALLENIIAIGQDLGMRVIAEGIEDSDIAYKLIEFGCNYGQGYLFSKPLPAALVPEFCAQDVALPAVGADFVI